VTVTVTNRLTAKKLQSALVPTVCVQNEAVFTFYPYYILFFIQFRLQLVSFFVYALCSCLFVLMLFRVVPVIALLLLTLSSLSEL